MAKFDYYCDRCGNKDIQDSFICKCGGTFKLEKNNIAMFEPFKPYVLENGVENPVYIDSREKRNEVFKEHGITQVPHRNRKYEPSSRIFPVSGSCSKGSGTRWTGNGLSY